MESNEINDFISNLTVIPRFEQWIIDNAQDIKLLQELLKIGMESTDPEAVKKDACEAEGWYARATTLLSDAEQLLDIAKAIKKKPKEKGETDFDRQIDLDSSVSTERMIRNKIKGLVESLKQRISLAQSLISYEKQSLFGTKG